MTPNGMSRKTPAASKATEDEDAFSPSNIYDTLRLEDEANVVASEEETPQSRLDKAGKWDAGKDAKVPSSPPTPTSLLQTSTPHLPTSVHNTTPLTHPQENFKCTHCKRAVSRATMGKHIETCLSKKQEKQRRKKEAKDARDAAARRERNGTVGDSDAEDDGDEGSVAGSGKRATGDGEGKAGKKRKAGDVDGEDNAAPAKKKKKKDNPDANADGLTTTLSKDSAANAKLKARPKPPVDVEKQCGVALPQGGQCARSLTCKSHSMGAKRAVPGRSARYDKLLLEYQRKNQAKQQRAQFDASAPNPDDEVLATGPVDEEAEREEVLAVIGRVWGGEPIFRGAAVPLREKYSFQRVRGMVSSALGGRGGGFLGGGGGGFFGGVGVHVGGGDDGGGGGGHLRRGSMAPGAARSGLLSGVRKSSLAV